MEKHLSLTYEEAIVLFEMCLFSGFEGEGEVAASALRKLGELCSSFEKDFEEDVGKARQLRVVAGR